MTQAAPVYRVRSQEIWDLARDDYLSGEPARVVCRRYDLGLSAFRIRARKAKWRREDQDDPDLYDPAVELEAVEDIALSDMAVSARRRLQLALEDGEATEAMRWLKIFETLSSLAADAPDLDEVHGLHPVFTPPAASPPSPPPNRAERRRLRRADRRKPISASGDGRASQGP
nr:hypothetical protein [uncultured Brevundimonas sp.]